MRLAATILLIGCALSAAEEPRQAPQGEANKGAAGKTAAQPGSATRPAAGSPAGTKVVQTPFGPSVRSAMPADREEAEKRHREAVASPLLKIEESGDTVTFRRRTPFGDQVWKKKRSELTEVEKEMIAAHQSGTPAGGTAPSRAATVQTGSSNAGARHGNGGHAGSGARASGQQANGAPAPSAQGSSDPAAAASASATAGK